MSMNSFMNPTPGVGVFGVERCEVMQAYFELAFRLVDVYNLNLMSRNVLVTIVVVILIAVAGGFYFMNRGSGALDPSQTAPEDSSAQPSAVMEKTSLKDFMGMSGDQKCEFSDTEAANSGTVYLNAGKFRGDFSSTVNGKVTDSHMINDGTDAYIWMDDQTTGFKTNLKAIEETSGQTGSTQVVDLDKQVDYKCSDWTVDPVKFVIPSEIKFQDMGKMMEDAKKMMPSTNPGSSTSVGGNTEACEACNNLEGDSQTQCKKALKCS